MQNPIGQSVITFEGSGCVTKGINIKCISPDVSERFTG